MFFTFDTRKQNASEPSFILTELITSDQKVAAESMCQNMRGKTRTLAYATLNTYVFGLNKSCLTEFILSAINLFEVYIFSSSSQKSY